MGHGTGGKLGHGASVHSNAVVQVSGITSGATFVDVGSEVACAIVSGAVQCWGDSHLGNGTSNKSSSPVAVTTLTAGVTHLDSSCSEDHTCAVMAGAAYCWGKNDDGQLGDGTILERLAPVAVSGLGANVTKVAAGSAHSCAIIFDGVNYSVRCWGNNVNGALGDGTGVSSLTPVTAIAASATPITDISAGGDHTCAVVNGGVKCWGEGNYGRLGDGSTSDNLSPNDVTGLTSGSGVTSVVLGSSKSCALLSTGAVKCWGRNMNGELGDGTFTNRSTPVDVIGMSSGMTSITLHDTLCGTTTGGSVRCAGSDRNGMRTTGSVFASSTMISPILLGDPSNLIVTGPATSTAGSCSTAFTVTLKDVSGNTEVAAANITVNLGEPGTGAFYSDSGCTASITTATINAATSTATFYYQAPTPQTIGIVNTATNLAPGFIKHQAL